MQTSQQLFEQLRREAIMKYRIPGPLVDQAIALNWTAYDVQQAQKDENGQPIRRPSLATLIVRGQHGWYVVRNKSCSCDTHDGICVHRIAAWIHREIIIRPLAEARGVAPSVIQAEWFDVGDGAK